MLFSEALQCPFFFLGQDSKYFVYDPFLLVAWKPNVALYATQHWVFRQPIWKVAYTFKFERHRSTLCTEICLIMMYNMNVDRDIYELPFCHVTSLESASG